LLLDAEVMVTLATLAVRVEVFVALLPTSTLPKLKLEGETVSWPAVELAPDPVSGMVNPAPGMKILPLIVPELCGAKVTFNVTLCP
jgi:hypothetical protein